MKARWLLLTPLALIAAAPERTLMQHATGTFEVKMTPEAKGDAPTGGLPTSRMGIAKTFIGGMTGSATGTMLAAGTPKPGHPAGYVAIDQFNGSVDGKAGSFLLLHRGTIDKVGGADLSVIIAPDSGTGALEGISGSFAITIEGGVHRYDLAYTLPTK
ncbi:DUF3224 domain-containing protein [Sphingomonas echinoides]|uniref:DUF3224 domain-containing protein n=1 Tax=Sphingomonas echinoides TaxID=59803 RepID=A0ABU4PIF8_9SPHN|nr:DUF3224 domain-containing protein [Sphingomonas echinoides]MDX5982927.1 DUF3224 domain-containing protein [Sphingomonas echinoides]